MVNDSAQGDAGRSLEAVFRTHLPDADWARLQPSVAVVGLFDVQLWMPHLDDARMLIDPIQAARVARQHRPADRALLTIAYACHRLLLGAGLGRPAEAVPLLRDPLGAPRLVDGSACTSLSHADGCIAVAMALQGPVGVDIEPRSRAAAMAEIAAQLVHPREQQAIDALHSPARDDALLALWVRKEACLKAAGVGLRRDMTTFVADDRSRPLGIDDLMTGIAVQTIDAGPHACAALAARAGDDCRLAWLTAG